MGFLHADRPGKPSLALDVMEELRAYLADRLAFSSDQPPSDHARRLPAPRQRCRRDGRRDPQDGPRRPGKQRKRETLTHPFLGEATTVGMLPHLQALLFVRWIRGDLDAYPPFLWKG